MAHPKNSVTQHVRDMNLAIDWSFSELVFTFIVYGLTVESELIRKVEVSIMSNTLPSEVHQ